MKVLLNDKGCAGLFIGIRISADWLIFDPRPFRSVASLVPRPSVRVEGSRLSISNNFLHHHGLRKLYRVELFVGHSEANCGKTGIVVN